MFLLDVLLSRKQTTGLHGLHNLALVSVSVLTSAGEAGRQRGSAGPPGKGPADADDGHSLMDYHV